MLSLDHEIETAIIEAKTSDRREVPVIDLEHMARTGDETPVSGDVLHC
jgi:hypothetical protein